MRSTILLALSMLLNSCMFINVPESIEKGEIRVEYPQTLPEMCYHLYKLESHIEWFECMGVEYK